MQKLTLSALVLTAALGLFTAPAASAAAAGRTAAAAPAAGARSSAASTPAGAPMASPAAASSEEVDTATAGSPDFGSHSACSATEAAEGCFVTYGDHLWVRDAAPDGLVASVYWENRLWNGSSWILWRNGRCENHLGSGKWGGCNKDFYENGTNPNGIGGKGSEVCVWGEVTGDVGDGICILNDE
jgi:hypothetical protein